MGLVAQRLNLISELKAFATAGKPMWGTCAGLILLADGAVGMPSSAVPELRPCAGYADVPMLD